MCFKTVPYFLVLLVLSSLAEVSMATLSPLLRHNGIGSDGEPNNPADYITKNRGDVDAVESIMLTMELHWGLKEMERYKRFRGFHPLLDGGSMDKTDGTVVGRTRGGGAEGGEEIGRESDDLYGSGPSFSPPISSDHVGAENHSREQQQRLNLADYIPPTLRGIKR